MINLGKIIVYLLFLATTTFANVTATVEPSTVYAGDSATYKLHISGKNIKKPTLSTLCGSDITATASQTSIESINGSYKKSYTLSYEFTPTKSCTINGINMEINSKMEQSNSVNLEVKPRSQDLNADFVLEFQASKTELYVGEPFTLTLYLKQKHSAQAVDSKYIAPDMSGFWVKSESAPSRYNEGDFLVTKVVYKLAPQREGSLKIDPAKLKIATRIGVNNWGTLIPQVRWRTFYSNPVTIQVKALPNNAKIIGNLTLQAKAQKLEVNPNEAVNVLVTVEGEGNLEDIESFKPYINDVNVFDEKIEIKGNKLTQKLVFVADKDFTIPPFELVYFDIKTKKLRKITTQKIDIKVRGNGKSNAVKITRGEEMPLTENPVIEVKDISQKTNTLYLVAVFVLGLLLGGLLMYLILRKKKSKKLSKLDIKNEKILLIKLLPYKDEDEDVAKIIAILEEHIYENSKEKIDKKLLKEIIQKYNIS